MEAALPSGETDTSQIICSANLISRSLRQERSSLELGGDGFGTFQSLLPAFKTSRQIYVCQRRTKQGLKTRRHTPGHVCPSEDGPLVGGGTESGCVSWILSERLTRSHQRRCPDFMSPCVGSPTDKRSLKSYTVLMCTPCRRRGRMDVLTDAPKQTDGSRSLLRRVSCSSEHADEC